MKDRTLDAQESIILTPAEAEKGCIRKLVINNESPIDLVIPPGIKHEQIMRLSGKGNYQPRTGRRGDLYLRILIEGEARTIRIRMDRSSSEVGTIKNRKKLVAAGMCMILVGALGVVTRHPGITRIQFTPGNPVISQTSKDDANKTHRPPDISDTVNKESTPETEQDYKNKSGYMTTNIVKVLDRVQCHESYLYCPQKTANRLWNACLEEGYIEGVPQGIVSSSRDIRELVSKSYVVQKQVSDQQERVDENGIVTNEDAGTRIINQKMKSKGYCIGTEYILKT